MTEEQFGAAWLAHARKEGHRKGFPEMQPKNFGRNRRPREELVNRRKSILDMFNAGLTQTEIAARLGLKRYAVYDDLRAMGVK